MNRAFLYFVSTALLGSAGCVPEATLVAVAGGAAGRDAAMQGPPPVLTEGCGTLDAGPSCTGLDDGEARGSIAARDPARADGGSGQIEAARIPRDGEWMRHLGSEGSDEVVALSTGTEDDVLVAGTAGGALTSAPDAGVPGGGAFLAKYHPSGDVIWARQFPGRAAALRSDASGNVDVAVLTNAALPGQSSLGGDAIFVRRYDTSGTELGTRQLGAEVLEGVAAVAFGADGSVGVANDADSTPPDAGLGGADVVVRKFEPDGTPLWTQRFGTTGNDRASSLHVDGAGSVIVAGISAGDLGELVASERDGFVRKYDGNGVELWTEQLGTPDAVSVSTDASGNVYVAGETNRQLPEQTSFGSADAFVRKYDAAGVQLWTRQFGTSRLDEATAVIVGRAGQVLVGGSTSGTPLGLGDFGANDVFIRAYTASGDELWTHRFGSTGSDRVFALAVDASGRVFAAGNTNGILPGEMTRGLSDAFVMRVID